MSLKLLGTTLIACAALMLPAHADNITLKVDTTPSIFADMFKELKTAFEAEHPTIRVDLDTPQRDQTDTIQRTMRQAVVGDLPDISFQGFNYLKLLADAGHIQPVDQLIAADKEWTNQRYSPSVTSATTISGKVYGLSVAYSFPVIFYNATLVAEAQGGNKELPADWDGILAVAQKIQKAHPDVLGAYTRYNAFMTQGYIMSRGGSLGNVDGTAVTFIDSKGREAFDLYRRFGELGQAKLDMTDAQVRQAYASGKVAILADSSSSLESFAKQAAGKFEIGTAHFPFATGAKLPTSGSAAVLHTKDPARQQAAWQFMSFVAGPEGQNILGRKTGYMPANQVAVNRADLLGDYYRANPAITGALASIPYANAWYVFKGPNTARIDKLFADRLQQVVTLQQTPEDAAQALSKDITGLIVK
ncbi:extracellular solute-binding protein [Rhizobium miluonense]|uniref:Multiple sugar transport system substrate-binding protein n=1 Tax=Rhizobium miluonense TaxID=411945 RepID=A0A1C3WDS1_9HYPH|nr:extracellular solute-binding protein [Rhizobium miluonense]SCB38045.1 multiple sugar transport system substrate-binding protein [Rhizobium miluonense]